MNLSEWRLALINAKLLPELSHVLTGFEFGFDQGIPVHKLGDLKWYTPDNHSSASDSADKIQKSIKEEVENKRMFGPFSHEEVRQRFPFFRTSPLGSVVNSDGKIRPINNLSYPRNDDKIRSVNSFVNKLNFSTTWDDFKTVASFFRNRTEPLKLALFDWAKAYRQIPTLMSQWPYLMVKDLDGGLYVDTRITFGGVAGCGSFGIPADAWKRIMEYEFDVVKIFRWVDDNLFIKTVDSACVMENITERSVKLGVATSMGKCSEFADEQKFIGFIWNGVNKTVRLPDKKLSERKSQIEVFLVGDTEFTFNQAQVLAGRLNHVAFILPQLRCYIRSVYRWMNQWKKQWATRKIPEDASFGIGVLVGRRWVQLRLKENWRISTPPRGIAWLETVAIRIGILMLQEMRIATRGSNFIVYTDNTTTESVLASRKSKDHHSNEEWKKIQGLLIESEMDLTPLRVISAENAADGLSRGIQRPHVSVDRVWINIPGDLQDFIFHA
ncbi:uncharacterized protein PGTG_21091 [Puccinia graminis f. sp. tritici CRL 75-36-700-3]|uniref:Uncharacterized protein n=1 Tax=Puccinia graminis f. sp. tritici (strain CRL 75-36-700-3 / race SCCL) TaxID=418459 RepID=H6QQD0_PUCGT|nr:uncharacterized protein PGTG_21091 [Puccinia graminis f. sp. tritici CRL 75-36-700-3]EHS62542.1 hypothetical protein PGTG_21091 [Puccinia graminis f. sp. tritici CRL 75-36-700-3]